MDAASLVRGKPFDGEEPEKQGRDVVGHTAWDSSIVWSDGGPKPK